MPRGGHNAKPTALKLVQGTARSDRLPLNEPKPAAAATIRAPGWLDDRGKRCWRKFAPGLRDAGLLTEADANTFALYCQAFSRYRRALDALATMDPVSDGYRDVAITVEKAEAALRLIGNDFGMSPASRTRLNVESKQARDPFEEFLSGDRGTG